MVGHFRPSDTGVVGPFLPLPGDTVETETDGPGDGCSVVRPWDFDHFVSDLW